MKGLFLQRTFGDPVFLPGSVSSPLALDAAMRAALAESLSHIHAVVGDAVDFREIPVAAAIAAINAHRVSPGVYGRYYDLVFAVQEQRYDDAGTLFKEIVALAAEHPAFAVLPFDEQVLGADKERYARLVGLENGSPANLVSPRKEDWLVFAANVTAALKLIEETDPSLAAELRALVIQVIAVASNADGGGFGGASSFMLWGAILLNVEHRTRLDMIAGLVHEAAHQLLFGLSIDERLVDNPIEERYGSPLRTDPRPMDGIYHATFVCARMHYAFARLQQVKDKLDDAERADLERRLSDYREKFMEGHATVERFGRLSANGRRIMSAAADYMQSIN